MNKKYEKERFHKFTVKFGTKVDWLLKRLDDKNFIVKFHEE